MGKKIKVIIFIMHIKIEKTSRIKCLDKISMKRTIYFLNALKCFFPHTSIYLITTLLMREYIL